VASQTAQAPPFPQALATVPGWQVPPPQQPPWQIEWLASPHVLSHWPVVVLQAVPMGQSPAPLQNGIVPVVVVVVMVVVVGQLGPLPGVGHASQQLVQLPTVPCFLTQWAASFLILHFVPLVVMRQQVTAVGFPHVECAAHFFTAPLQLRLTSTTLACWTAQLT
jgi:hypothetical protein